MNTEKRLKSIISSWFIKEPLLFSAVTTHTLLQNENMNIPLRTGQRRIEFNPNLLEQMEDTVLEDYLKIETFRILLGHPYKRQPFNAKKGVLLLASDVTINQFFKTGGKEDLPGAGVNTSGVEYCKNQAVRFTTLEHPLGIKWIDTPELKFFQRNMHVNPKTQYLETVDELSFEQWYSRLVFLISQTAVAGTENAGSADGQNPQFSKPELDQASELWEEDEGLQKEITDQIQKAEIDHGWGGLGGNAVRTLKDECDFAFDYRRVLAKFRSNIISANRNLTRMKPSRRYGFKAMGSRYDRKANILIAVDVSGSITEESFEHFYHAIKNFFFLGIIEKIDLLFFDVNLKNTTPINFRKKIELSQIAGRGGTNFQPALDYYSEHTSTYNGLIFFTDGEGPVPHVSANLNILWILEGRLAWEKSHQWIEKLPGSKATYLPF